MTFPMRSLLSGLLVLLAAPGALLADGPPEYTGPYPADEASPPEAAAQNTQGMYQPPPDGICLDDENQATDCSQDQDYASYSQVDDGYDPQAYQDFQTSLSPYGNWVNTSEYGQVWVPSSSVVGSDFTPYYTGGRWDLTDYGWTWLSDYSWGWGPFHYGRWSTIGNYGWCWIPGRVWGPAWVHWRAGGGYVGWTPLPPRGIRIGSPMYGSRWNRWSFVQAGQLNAPRLMRMGGAGLPGIWSATVVANDFRAIGSNRIVYGPPAHHFHGTNVIIRPTPIGRYQMALPRAHVTYQTSLPMAQRPYYAPVYRGGIGGVRPGYQPAPAYQGPGRPGYQPAPAYQGPGRPGYQPAPAYQGPGRPGYQPAPAYQGPGRPGYQPAPAYQGPARPAYQPAPNYQAPARPAYQPAPNYQAPARPTYQPAPSYQAPSRPTYQPAPSYQAPSRPTSQPAPSYQAPSRPTYQPPSGGGGSVRFGAPPPRAR